MKFMKSNHHQPTMSTVSSHSTFIYPENSSTWSGTGVRLSAVNGRTVTQMTQKTKSKWNLEISKVKCLIGTVIAVMGAVCWVGATVLYKRSYTWPTFYAPFFLVYFTTSWIILFYPLHAGLQLLKTRDFICMKEILRNHCKIFGHESLGERPHIVIAKLGAFCVIWTLTNYAFLRALTFKGSLDVISLFATNSCFVYLMSWILLQKRFIAFRIVAFIIAMTGVIMILYMEEGFVSTDIWGGILAMLSTAGGATYQVLCKRTLGETSCGQLSLFLSVHALCNSLIMWPVFLLLYFTNAEPIEWQHVPWQYVCGSTLFAIGFEFLSTFGAAYTYPPFISSSLVLAIPVCLGAELLWNKDNLSVNGMQKAAYVLIFLSFPLNIFPEQWYDNIIKVITANKEEISADNAHLTPRQRLKHSTVFNGHSY